MGKKKKHKDNYDFWGSPEEQFDEICTNENEEVDIFSLGKVKKHYSGIEPEIVADINRVFGSKEETTNNYDMNNVTESENFISSLKEDTTYNNEICFDSSMVEPSAIVNKPFSFKKHNLSVKPENTESVNTDELKPITIRFNSPILSLSDSKVSLYYKMIPDHNTLTYVNSDIIYDDLKIKELSYLINYIMSYRYPTALFKLDEFDYIFDGLKGSFADEKSESKYMFIKFDEYIAAYYMGNIGDDFATKLSRIKGLANSNSDIADIIMGLTIESLGYNVAFTKDDYAGFYKSIENRNNKEKLVNAIRRDIIPGSDSIDVIIKSFDKIFIRSEEIISKYVKDDRDESIIDQYTLSYNPDNTHSSEDTSIKKTIEESITKSINDILNEEDNYDDYDDEDDDDATEIDDESELVSEDDIDSMIDEAVNEDSDGVEEDEPTSMPIDKVAINNNTDNKSMVVEVTRKTHP